jgi:hypothetical protein
VRTDVFKKNVLWANIPNIHRAFPAQLQKVTLIYQGITNYIALHTWHP